MEYVLLGARCLVGVVFVVSAVSKLRSRRAFTEFVASLRQLGLLRPAGLRPAGLAVALTEAAIPVLLIAPVAAAALEGAPGSAAANFATGAGFALAGGLLVAFTVAILLAMRRGVQAPCRCFGASATPLGVRHVVRNGFILVVTTIGVAGVLVEWTGATHPGGAVIAALTGLVAGVLITTFDDLVDLFVASPRTHRPSLALRDTVGSGSARR